MTWNVEEFRVYYNAMLHVNIIIMTLQQRWYLLLSYFNNKINFLFSCEIRSWSLRFCQFDICQGNTLVHSIVPNKWAKFGAKIFKHFWDIAIFVLGYFLPVLWSHLVWFMIVICCIYYRLLSWLAYVCRQFLAAIAVCEYGQQQFVDHSRHVSINKIWKWKTANSTGWRLHQRKHSWFLPTPAKAVGNTSDQEGHLAEIFQNFA